MQVNTSNYLKVGLFCPPIQKRVRWIKIIICFSGKLWSREAKKRCVSEVYDSLFPLSAPDTSLIRQPILLLLQHHWPGHSRIIFTEGLFCWLVIISNIAKLYPVLFRCVLLLSDIIILQCSRYQVYDVLSLAVITIKDIALRPHRWTTHIHTSHPRNILGFGLSTDIYFWLYEIFTYII